MMMSKILATFLLLCLAVAPTWAQTQMPSAVVSGGGADMLGSNTVRGTVGQSAVGLTAGVSHRMEIGFWHGYGQPVSVTAEVPTFIWDLQAAYPNPFNPKTSIGYSLPENSHVTLRVYDLRGSLVTTLVDGQIEAGDHVAVWNGRGDSGRGVASGMYFARIESTHGVLTSKMVLTK
jgi:hypothetical protein